MSRRTLLSALAAAGLAGLVPAAASADPTSEELQAQLDEARAQLASMGDALAGLQDDLASQTEAVEATRSEIFGIETQMGETESQLAQKRSELGERMSASYKEGAGSALDLILGAASVEELVSRIYYLDKLSEADAARIAEVNDLAAQLQGQRDSLVAQQEEQEAQVASTQQSLEEYQAQVASAQSYYASLDQQVQEQLAAEAAEEAARQAAEAEASQGAQSTGIANAIETVTGGQGAQTGTEQPSAADPEPEAPETPAEEPAAPAPAPTPEPDPEPEAPSGGGTTPSGGAGHPEIVSAAATMIGKPYKQWWTGVNYGPGAAGYDCCGLVATAYHLCGYSYPAYQAPVASIMASIRSRGNWKDCNLSNYQSVLSPGDVIVCSTGHVAIYAGGDQMIHAPYVGAYVCYARVYACIGGGFGG